MNEIAIHAENISKRYRIGQKQRYFALRDIMANAFASAFRPFGKNHQSDKTNFFWALRDINFQIAPSETVGIVGLNGAGKSTLLRILSKITKPTTGFAEFQGRVSSLLEVGSGFHLELTGRENIFLNGVFLGMKKEEIQRKFDEIVEFAEVEQFIDTPVKFYSSGMYVRLAFSVAAHLEPEILLVDEVLAVGDVAFQKKCINKMGGAAKDGKTILFVSHNIASLRSLCKKGLWLHHGKLVAEGDMASIINRYLQSMEHENQTDEISPEMHAINTGEVWIERISLRKKTGEISSQFHIGEPIQIKIAFTIVKPIQSIRIGVGINTADGVRISTLHYPDDSGGSNFHAGTYEIILELVNSLLPGTYYVSLGAHRVLGTQTIDYIPQARRFQVVAVSQVGNVYHSFNHGIVSFQGTWSEISVAPEGRGKLP